MEKKKREKLDLGSSSQEMFITMSEGNPGALRVIMELAKGRMHTVLFLESMNMRGWQIWEAYKYCGQDLDRLTMAVALRDHGMVGHVNREATLLEQAGEGTQEMATTRDVSMRDE